MKILYQRISQSPFKGFSNSFDKGIMQNLSKVLYREAKNRMDGEFPFNRLDYMRCQPRYAGV